ncbi:MAG: bifunctional metallophosphatase/5'-nucleotidase [Proteobacteria bacterium]|nr:bifunctional metallophosphatase/5'-nucleotidase [Pseudomonadota bacterium]
MRALLLAAALLTAGTAPAAEAVALRVVALNDWHGHLAGDGLSLPLGQLTGGSETERVPLGSAAALAGLVRALCSAAPHCLVLASGDLIGAAPLESTLFRHESTIAVAAALGVQVAAVGNHEFDAGLTELRRLQRGGCAPADATRTPTQSCAAPAPAYRGMPFALLGANVQGAGLAPSWVTDVGGVRVGVVGAITRTTPGIVRPSGIKDLRFEDEATALNREAAALARRGVHTVLALVHEGGHTDGGDWNGCAGGLRGAMAPIAEQLTPAYAAVLSAHTHQGYRCTVAGRPVVQATSYGRGISVLDLTLNPATGRATRVQAINLPVLRPETPAALREAVLAATPLPWRAPLAAARPDAAVARQVAAWVAAAAPLATLALAPLEAPFERGDADEARGTLGRLVADAQQQAAAHLGADLALMNPGGLRADLRCAGQTPCQVTYGQVFTAQPFGNSLVVLTLTGAQLKALLEAQNPERLLHVSRSLRYTWAPGAPAGQRVRELRLNGRPVAPRQPLRVVVNSYMAEGGNGLTILKAATGPRQGAGPDVDALAAALQAGATPDPEPRVRRLSR